MMYEHMTNLELINRCKGEFIDPVAFRELEARRVPIDWHNPNTDLLAVRTFKTTARHGLPSELKLNAPFLLKKQKTTVL